MTCADASTGQASTTSAMILGTSMGPHHATLLPRRELIAGAAVLEAAIDRRRLAGVRCLQQPVDVHFDFGGITRGRVHVDESYLLAEFLERELLELVRRAVGVLAHLLDGQRPLVLV